MPLIINKTLLSLLNIFPKSLMKKLAMRYVAGETWEEATENIEKLNDIGFSATVDILGEHSTSNEGVLTVKKAYLNLYDMIEEKRLDCSISLKLTHLGLGYDNALAEDSLLEILKKAKERKNFLRIDMENSPYTDNTIRLFKKCFKQYHGVGLVFQSYLRRSADDLAMLVGEGFNVRICKGIYRESPNIAFQDRDEIRRSFIQLVQTGLTRGAYVAIATHDLYLIDTLETWLENKGIQKNEYEFQVLYGVPMKGRLESLLEVGHQVRIYVPFGKEWYLYAVRRLEENPHMAIYILKNLLKKK